VNEKKSRRRVSDETQTFNFSSSQLACLRISHRILFSVWRRAHVTGASNLPAQNHRGCGRFLASRGWQPASLVRALQNPQPSFIITTTTPASIIVITSS
jgi:hypothetical protein